MFSEGIFLIGIFAYVAVMLLEAGEPRASIAGLVIASFAVGGIVYSLSIGTLLRLLGQKRVMIAGGLFMALGTVALAFAPSWQVQFVVVAMMGLGFYMLHASIQVFVTGARASHSRLRNCIPYVLDFRRAVDRHRAFGYGLALIGTPATLAICAVAIALTGIISAQLLTRPRPV